MIPNIIKYERKVETNWCGRTGENSTTRFPGLRDSADRPDDQFRRNHARLSSVRMGINLELIDDLGIPAVNELLIHTQPAHLQKFYNSELEVRERNEGPRQGFPRGRLAERRGEQN
ncbi:MAG: hypothetical protein Ct9H300mP1_20020 [Planctomycetaceae bacterium]|nr:MAG: hypothetical protein Ct9H300mP1_20020 [Planctomycetaceae bacterium]